MFFFHAKNAKTAITDWIFCFQRLTEFMFLDGIFGRILRYFCTEFLLEILRYFLHRIVDCARKIGFMEFHGFCRLLTRNVTLFCTEFCTEFTISINGFLDVLLCIVLWCNHRLLHAIRCRVNQYVNLLSGGPWGCSASEPSARDRAKESHMLSAVDNPARADLLDKN